MRYAAIRTLDISNGNGLGIAIFTQGCPYHCKGCHNKETWDFNNGNEWTREQEDILLNELKKRPQITRLSLLGGEPLLPCNAKELRQFIEKALEIRPNLEIWAWTGDTAEHLLKSNNKDLQYIFNHLYKLIDGRFEQDKADVTLKYRGSTNQRVLDKEDIQKLLNA